MLTALLLLASPAAAQGPPWWEHLRDLMPALRGCLADRPGAMVVEAWFMNRGLALARVQVADGTRLDCVADLGSGRIERTDPVAPDSRLPGEGLRAFMLERRCVDAQRVDGPDGRELGWLAYPACG